MILIQSRLWQVFCGAREGKFEVCQFKKRSIAMELKRQITMRRMYVLAWSVVSVLLSSCAAFRGAGDIAQGRQELIEGNNQAALGYFQSAERADPKYIYGTDLRAGVLSYLGRAQYHRRLCASAAYVGKSGVSGQGRQYRAALPWPYLGSPRRDSEGFARYRRGYERNL